MLAVQLSQRYFSGKRVNDPKGTPSETGPRRTFTVRIQCAGRENHIQIIRMLSAPIAPKSDRHNWSCSPARLADKGAPSFRLICHVCMCCEYFDADHLCFCLLSG